MIEILIVDDRHFTIQALQAILETEPDFEVTGVTSGSEAIKYLEQTKVDLAIVDLEMPKMSGLTLTKIFSQRFPDTKVIILSSHDDESNINSAVESGARGYLLKNTSSPEIIDTIRAVQRGYFQLGPGLFEKLLSHFIREKEQAANRSLCLEEKYVRLAIDLEEKIMFLNETERLKTHQELEREIENLKREFRSGLKNFQNRVSNQLQNGIEAANNKLRDSIPDFEKIQAQVDNRNFEQQRYLNTLLAGNKQTIKKLQNKVDSIQRLVIVLSFIFFLITTLLLIGSI